MITIEKQRFLQLSVVTEIIRMAGSSREERLKKVKARHIRIRLRQLVVAHPVAEIGDEEILHAVRIIVPMRFFLRNIEEIPVRIQQAVVVAERRGGKEKNFAPGKFRFPVFQYVPHGLGKARSRSYLR